MSRRRQFAYLIAGLTVSVGLALMVMDYSLGLPIIFVGGMLSHIGKPKLPPKPICKPPLKPFWTGSRFEWSTVIIILLFSISLCLFLAFREPATESIHSSKQNDSGLRLWQAILVGLVYLGVQAFRYRREKLAYS